MSNYEETGKKISRRRVWEAIENQDCEEALLHFTEFDNAFSQWSWDEEISFHPGSELYRYLRTHPILYLWTIKHGFLQKKPGEEWYIEVEDHKTPIGEDLIFIKAVTKSGRSQIILCINKAGELEKAGGIDKKTGLTLNEEGRIEEVR